MLKPLFIILILGLVGCQKDNQIDNSGILTSKEIAKADSLAKVNAIIDPGTNIWIDANDKITINPNIFGLNNDWAQVTNAQYATFAKANDANSYTILRYPGGFESEYYNWNNNTTPNWANTPSVAGATPNTMKNNSSNYGIVIPIQNAMLKSLNSQAWLDAVSDLKIIAETSINSLGINNIKVVEIGNEWWLHYGGGVSRADKLIKYAKIAMNLAEHIDAKYPNRSFKLLVNGDYSEPDEFTTLKNQFAKAYHTIDGVALHTYTGYIENGHNIETLEAKIEECANNWNPNKKYIYCSEWAPSRLYNDGKLYMEAANIIPDIVHIYARSGVSAGAYWPPINTSIPGLGLYDTNFGLFPCGQIFSDLAKNYTGEALKTMANSSLMANAALQNSNTMILYVAGKDLSTKTASIKVSGFTIKSIVSAVKLRPESYSQTNKDVPYIKENAIVALKTDNKLLFEVNKEGKYQIFKVIVSNL
ncbi:MAG: hypothetical protein WBO36_17105 [Saprospiraceae bacterium]